MIKTMDGGNLWTTTTKVVEVETHQDLPFKGAPGLYFVKKMNRLCRWDEQEEDWLSIGLDRFTYNHPEDKHNGRRAAIMSQRKRDVQE